jgi:hypothetical protein
MEVRMRLQISGTRNGVKWPRAGATLTCSNEEGRHLIRAGLADKVAEPVKAAPAPPKPAPAPPKASEPVAAPAHKPAEAHAETRPAPEVAEKRDPEPKPEPPKAEPAKPEPPKPDPLEEVAPRRGPGRPPGSKNKQ